MTDECALDALVPKLGCIATYNSSLDEMALNYAVLIVTTLSVFSTGPAWPRLCCVVFLVAFQVTLCLWLSCAGVSVVWASLASLIFVDARRSRGAPARLLSKHTVEWRSRVLVEPTRGRVALPRVG